MKISSQSREGIDDAVVESETTCILPTPKWFVWGLSRLFPVGFVPDKIGIL